MVYKRPPTSGDPTGTPADVSWALHNFVVAAAALDIALGSRLDLSPAEYRAMQHVLTATEPMGPVELGALVGLGSGAATGLVDRLERAGRLRRRRDPDDRRRLILEPTSDAVEATIRELRPLDDVLQERMARLTADERRIIVRFLRETTGLYRAFSKQTAHGAPAEREAES